MLNFFKTKTGEIHFLKVGILVIVVLFVITIAVLYFMFGGSSSTEQKSSLNIDTGIPAKSENVNIERNNNIIYVTEDEVERMVASKVTSEMKSINMQISENQKENIDNIKEFLNEYDKEFNKKIDSLEINKPLEKNNLENEIIENLEQENINLKEEIEDLEDRIEKLEKNKNNTQVSSKPVVNDRKIELPGNNYSSGQKSSNVKTETKIVYRDRVVEKENKPSKVYIPFTLDGIFTGKNNIAVISENGNTVNIKAGQNYKQFSIKEIKSNSILVQADKRTIEITMNDGGREF